MKNYAIIDPSSNANDNLVANNIGDEIIFNAINANFFHEIKDVNLMRFTSHRSLNDSELKLVNSADSVFFGGTNIVSLDVCHDSRWIPKHRKFYYLMPGIHNLIFIGVGMNHYSNPLEIKKTCKLRTKLFYKNLLSKDYIHSVRDHQTLEALNSMGFKNVLFTSCPTLWSLNAKTELNVEKATKKCVLSLTDYDKNPIRDNSLINELAISFEELNFFPQGKGDLDYLYSLDSYINNKDRITILPRSLVHLESMVNINDFIYIGTRLHLGIFFMNKGIKSLIIGIDNRAIEMKKSVNLPVILPSELNLIKLWVSGDKLFGHLNLPFENITKWKSQFK